MGISYQQLRAVDLSSLSDAVDKWRNLPGQFDAIARSFGTTVTKGLTESNWKGEAAAEALGKFDVVEKQMKAAADEAQDIHDLLKSALDSFQSAKDELKKIEGYVHDDKYLEITAEGHVYCDTSKAENGQQAALQKGYLDTVHDCNNRIEAALKDADDADIALSWALTMDANGRKEGFNTETASSISEASRERKESLKEARAMVKLAQLGNEMTTAQIQQMNKVFATYEGDPLFNEKFATGLGGKGTLQFWAAMADPKVEAYSRDPKPSEERLKQLKALQDNLGRSLASATHSDTKAMRAWEKEVIDLGGRRIDSEDAANPYGFQVMSNLMREGNFDTKFLHDYGDALMKEDKRWDGPLSPADYWTRNSETDLNFGAKDDHGQDPMTGFMQALGHNPDASIGFFSSDKNFDYLTSDREWPSDGTGDNDTGASAGYRSLSHALESATTGHPFDEGPTAGMPGHTKDQADLMTKIVHGISDPKDDFKLHKGMETSLGQMTAEYMPDIHRALSGGEAGGTTLADLYPLSGTQAKFTEQDITRFMYDIGQTPDGYKALNIGESLYTSDLMGYHLANPDAYGETTRQTIQEISARNSEVQGILGLARQDSDIQNSAEGDAQFNKDMDKWKAWANTAASIGIGVGVSTAASPVAGAFAVAATEDLTGQMIDGLFPDPRDRSDEALFKSGKDWEVHKASTLQAAQLAASAANGAFPSGLDQAEIESAVREGHLSGNDHAHSVLDEYRRQRGKA
ncbi:DUF6571 family protein [Streptomyces griseoruber]|uniref:PPE family domain-containing protein n=1 Tax=Streptomyces griseoruber TaxID=1943 RepID=A0A101SSK2_9ACTN|nr:DUF6571 family protein [Streptomyces griseoruber]KUN79387.1 hypothetical protein AQJ64_28950 [Streptomyces griseoruber]